MINLIAAASKNGVIGKDGQLPWDIPEDLKFFKEKTKSCNIIMGRKTYESIGKPLPKRVNIVVTRQNDLFYEGVVVVNSMEDAIKKCERNKNTFIIGGEQIYKAFMPMAQKIYLTQIEEEIEGDTYFPEIDENEWNKNKIKEIDHKGTKVNFFEYDRGK